MSYHRRETTTRYRVCSLGKAGQVVQQSQYTTRVKEPEAYSPPRRSSGRRDSYNDRAVERQRDEIVLTSGQLLSEMAIDRNEIQIWKRNATVAFGRLSKEQRMRGAGLLYSDSFRDLLESRTSGITVVHAGDDEDSMKKPYSCLSAPILSVYDWLYSRKATLSVPFFCGTMRQNDGSTPGAIRKMLHLIISGIVHFKADGTHSFPGLCGRRLREMDTSYLCTIMKTLFFQAMDVRKFCDPSLRALNVTVFIDGAQYLETRDHLDDFRRVIDAFKEIVKYTRRLNRGDVFKVFLLFPERSNYAYNVVAGHEVVRTEQRHIERARKDGSLNADGVLPDLNDVWKSRGSYK